MQKLKKSSDSRYIKLELDKACFQHDTAYGDIKDLTKRTVSGKKKIRYKAFSIAKIRNIMDIKEVLLQCSINIFINNLW